MSSVYDSEDENAIRAFFEAMDNSIQSNQISSTNRIRLNSVGEEDIESEMDWSSPPINENTHWGWASEEEIFHDPLMNEIEIFRDNDNLDIFDENNFEYDLIYQDPSMNADAYNEDAINDLEMGLNDDVIWESIDVSVIDDDFYFSQPDSRPISPSFFLTDGAIPNVDRINPVLSGTAPAVFHLENERTPRNNPVIIDLTSDNEDEEMTTPSPRDDNIIIEISDDDE